MSPSHQQGKHRRLSALRKAHRSDVDALSSMRGTAPTRESHSLRCPTANGSASGSILRPSRQQEQLDMSIMSSASLNQLKCSLATCRTAWADHLAIIPTDSQKIESDSLYEYCKRIWQDCDTQLNAVQALFEAEGDVSGTWGTEGKGDYILLQLRYAQSKLDDLLKRPKEANSEEDHQFLQSIRSHNEPLADSYSSCQACLASAAPLTLASEGTASLQEYQAEWEVLHKMVRRKLKAATALGAGRTTVATRSGWGTAAKADDLARALAALKDDAADMLEQERSDGVENEGALRQVGSCI